MHTTWTVDRQHRYTQKGLRRFFIHSYTCFYSESNNSCHFSCRMSCNKLYGINWSSKKTRQDPKWLGFVIYLGLGMHQFQKYHLLSMIKTLKLYAHHLDSGQTTQVHIERTPQVFHSFIHLFLFRIKQFMPFVLPFLRCQPVSMSCDKFYGIVWSSKKKIGTKVH